MAARRLGQRLCLDDPGTGDVGEEGEDGDAGEAEKGAASFCVRGDPLGRGGDFSPQTRAAAARKPVSPHLSIHVSAKLANLALVALLLLHSIDIPGKNKT